MQHARPVVLLSACIEMESCRPDGSRVSSDTVRMISNHTDMVPLCPERELEPALPRTPLRIVALPEGVRLMETGTGRDMTTAMREWSYRTLSDMPPPDGIILKGGSPSCGPGDAEVYPSAGGSEPVAKNGMGIFAAMILSLFPLLPVETDTRLEDWTIREHFLTALFAAADLRRMKSHLDRGLLQEFHARHKLLLMARDEEALRELGPLAADAIRPVDEVLDVYGKKFLQAMQGCPSPGSHVNVLQHIMGFFSKGMTAAEKKKFLDTLEGYRRGIIPLAECIGLARRFIDEHDIVYLKNQAYFEPYPRSLDRQAQ